MTKKDEKKKLIILEGAKEVFKDAEYFHNEKLLMRCYELVQQIVKKEKLSANSTSLIRIFHILGKLDKKYSDVIYYRFIDNLNLTECGKLLGCSRTTVRNREYKAINLLCDYKSELISDYEKDFMKRKALFKEAILSGIVFNDDILIEELNLRKKTCNSLLRAKIYTASQLCAMTDAQLLKISNISPLSIKEIHFVKSKLLYEI